MVATILQLLVLLLLPAAAMALEQRGRWLRIIPTDIVAWFRRAPAFNGPVAGSLKNRELVVSGISTSLVGLTIGNCAGLFVACFQSTEGGPW